MTSLHSNHQVKKRKDLGEIKKIEKIEDYICILLCVVVYVFSISPQIFFSAWKLQHKESMKPVDTDKHLCY